MSNTEQKPNEGEAIVLNRMYVGDYLSTNLGHEVINMFQADNGSHYLYLNAYGNFSDTHSGQIGYMLLVKYHTEGVLEVVGKAEGLTDVAGVNVTLSQDYKSVNPDVSQVQNDYIEAEKITYGGVSIRKIFNDAEQQNIFITYKAARLYRPNRPIFIGYGVEADVVLTGYRQAKTSLKTYVYPEGTFKGDQNKENVEEKKADYKKLRELIEKDGLWEESKERIDDELLKIKNREVSIFDICQIQNDENRFSYALAYFMTRPQYRSLWRNFFKQYGVELGENYTVAREESAKIDKKDTEAAKKPSGGRIDLLIRDEKNIIVIENKIKSDINTIETDRAKENEIKESEKKENKETNEEQRELAKESITQLDRYVNYVCWCVKGEAPSKENPDVGKTPHFFILTPNYNIPEISEEMKEYYKIITYRSLYDFLKITSAVKEDSNFKAFFEAMHRHTHNNVNDYLYYEMMEKFIQRIKEAIDK